MRSLFKLWRYTRPALLAAAHGGTAMRLDLRLATTAALAVGLLGPTAAPALAQVKNP